MGRAVRHATHVRVGTRRGGTAPAVCIARATSPPPRWAGADSSAAGSRPRGRSRGHRRRRLPSSPWRPAWPWRVPQRRPPSRCPRQDRPSSWSSASPWQARQHPPASRWSRRRRRPSSSPASAWRALPAPPLRSPAPPRRWPLPLIPLRAPQQRRLRRLRCLGFGLRRGLGLGDGDVLRMSIRQPVRRAASRAFCPRGRWPARASAPAP